MAGADPTERDGWRNGRRTRGGKGGTKGTRSVRSFATERRFVRVYHRATCRRRSHRIVFPDAFVCSSLQRARLLLTACLSHRALFRPLSFLCVFSLIRIDDIRGLDRDLFGRVTGTCHPFVSGFRPGLLSWPLIGREVLPGAKVREPQPLGWITSPRTGVSAIYVRKKEKQTVRSYGRRSRPMTWIDEDSRLRDVRSWDPLAHPRFDRLSSIDPFPPSRLPWVGFQTHSTCPCPYHPPSRISFSSLLSPDLLSVLVALRLLFRGGARGGGTTRVGSPPVSSPWALEGTDPWVLHPGEPDGLSQSKGDGFGSVWKGGKGPRWIHEWISCHPPPAIHVAPPQSSTSTSHRTRSCSYHRHGNRPPLRRVPCAWNRTPQPRGTPAARHPRSTPASPCVHRHLGDAGRDRNHRVSRRHLHPGCC